MDSNQTEWKKIARGLTTKGFSLYGESLKKPPRGYDADHPLLEDLKRKDYIATQDLKLSTITEADFVKQSAKLFASTRPLIKFICEANDLDF